MGRNSHNNHHKRSFAAAACLASLALPGGLGNAGSRAAAAAITPTPVGPDFALHLADAAAGSSSSCILLDPAGPADGFSLAPSSVALLDYTAASTGPAAPAPVPNHNFIGFHKGVWDVEITGSHMSPIRHTRDHINAGGAGVGYFIADGFSLNAALIGYSIDQPHNYAVGAGFDLYARLFLVTLDRVSLYVDGGAGAIMTDKAVPEYGTAFNFTPRGGAGISVRVDDNVYLIGGARYWHLSNAGYHSIARNPSFDSVQYYGGVIFTF